MKATQQFAFVFSVKWTCCNCRQFLGQTSVVFLVIFSVKAQQSQRRHSQVCIQIDCWHFHVKPSQSDAVFDDVSKFCTSRYHVAKLHVYMRVQILKEFRTMQNIGLWVTPNLGVWKWYWNNKQGNSGHAIRKNFNISLLRSKHHFPVWFSKSWTAQIAQKNQ